MSASYLGETLRSLGNRGAILQRIEQGYDEKREIAEGVSKSRSSVDRDLRLLKRGGFIGENRNTYEVTTFGKHCLVLYRQASKIAEAKELFPHFPPDAPTSIVFEGEVITSGGTVPNQPIGRISELIGEAAWIKVLAPIVLREPIEELTEQLRDGEGKVEMVVSEEVFSELCDEGSELVEYCTKKGPHSIRKVGDELPFGLLILDEDTMCLWLLDESQRFLGTVVSDSIDALDWSQQVFAEGVEASQQTLNSA